MSEHTDDRPQAVEMVRVPTRRDPATGEPTEWRTVPAIVADTYDVRRWRGRP